MLFFDVFSSKVMFFDIFSSKVAFFDIFTSKSAVSDAFFVKKCCFFDGWEGGYHANPPLGGGLPC